MERERVYPQFEKQANGYLALIYKTASDQVTSRLSPDVVFQQSDRAALNFMRLPPLERKRALQQFTLLQVPSQTPQEQTIKTVVMLRLMQARLELQRFASSAPAK